MYELFSKSHHFPRLLALTTLAIDLTKLDSHRKKVRYAKEALVDHWIAWLPVTSSLLTMIVSASRDNGVLD